MSVQMDPRCKQVGARLCGLAETWGDVLENGYNADVSSPLGLPHSTVIEGHVGWDYPELQFAVTPDDDVHLVDRQGTYVLDGRDEHAAIRLFCFQLDDIWKQLFEQEMSALLSEMGRVRNAGPVDNLPLMDRRWVLSVVSRGEHLLKCQEVRMGSDDTAALEKICATYRKELANANLAREMVKRPGVRHLFRSMRR